MMTLMDQVERRRKRLGYKGCKNCEFQDEKLRQCEWGEHGGDRRLHFICPRWRKKGESDGR